MSFGRSKKQLHQQSKYHPPPGYYEPSSQTFKSNGTMFCKVQRFTNKIQNYNPGPGAYYSHEKDNIKKRLLQQAKKKQTQLYNQNNPNDIKISSIPSIPKKSATRVYEELAPGILILHEEQYQNVNIGPGSYEINQNMIRKRPLGPKIFPQPKKRIIVQQQQVKVPTMAQQLRNQKRLLYKQNVIKSSTINKNLINSSDLCLQTIILRQKLLRGQQNPPPGHYYNQNTYSTFKKPDSEKSPELQALGGKQQRFKIDQIAQIGPGAYQLHEYNTKKGGFIPKNQKNELVQISKVHQPGPGAYQIISAKQAKQEPKGNYPPIFGSGSKRFSSAPKQLFALPGPGSYKIDKKKNKKVKYIKIKKQFYESQGLINRNQFINPLNDLGKPDNTYYSVEGGHSITKKQKNTHYFKSKVERFLNNKKQDDVGPGKYDIRQNSMHKQTFNRSKDGYVGDKFGRFQDFKIRPNIGPGTYQAKYETVKEKKTSNIIF